ncbi:Lysozyme RrrD [Gemmata obscuriglobus]|uniref:Lysozyme n=1 Tax=Gemmata obscuriglobus TaxID=114 RepID=A0A2Z3H7L7_9BACT|nr:lysozyme [Gemmata obscuriglobus]AWM37010.1 hypothetical protein C1280_08245 [Gemmata obscuriglobus]QEG30289.1 Lysozyme RrrD [Gemmata obscuriglobus]VTS09613.1 lysozyme : Lysozyme OS=Pelagibaca bermudensis (strain JCM 13377 / KCTC 12554 / HTCC2601) GN=R2601_22771 PE=3 SV=1: Phage_lysozyme [Gemmata obscuriglobus UQM 2246]
MASKSQVVKGGGLIAAAMLLAIPFITDHEGESLKAYQDVGGVYTICHGETSGVKAEQVATKEACDALTKSRVGQFMAQVHALHKVELSPATLAAHTSMAYNIGIAAYARSTTLRLTNAGNIAAGCRAMANWYTAGGKDCRVRSNNCYGLINRRNDEIALCLAGLK